MRQVAALVGWLWFAGIGAAQTHLVLPFDNRTGDPNLGWLGESMSETIRDTLGAEGILVVDRGDVQEAFRRLGIRADARRTRASAIRIAETLDAGYLVFGSYELLPAADAKSRGTLRVQARTVDVRNARSGSAYSESGALEDLARVQAHLAWQTLKSVAPERAPTEQEFMARTPLARVDAIEHYTRGLLAATPDAKLRFFSEAVRLDATLVDAQFHLGVLHWHRKEYKSAAAALSRVPPTGLHHREAEFYLGLARYMLGDYSGAQKAFEEVASEVPLNEVWNNLGAAQAKRSPAAALESFQKAIEGDAADPDYHFNAGLALFRLGRLDEAADRFRAALDRRQDDPEATTMLGHSLTAGRRRPQVPSGVSERLKHRYEESAYLQLKAVLERPAKGAQ